MDHKEETEEMRKTSNENLIKSIFNKLDDNKDGQITAEEIEKAGLEIGIKINLSKANKLVAELDKTGRGYILFGEFRTCMLKVLNKIHRDNEIYKASFKKIDADGNGFIDETELQQVLCQGQKKMSEAQVKEMFEEADIDGDGQLSFNEFVNYFCKID